MFSNSKKEYLKQLWKDIFEDSDDYLNLIFDNIYNENISPIEVSEDRETGKKEASSGLIGVDYELVTEGRSHLGAYLCGVATRPAYRRHGRMFEMIKQLLKELPSMGYKFSFLIPASDSLRRYYARLGFVDMGEKRLVVLKDERDFKEIEKLVSEHLNGVHNEELKQNIECEFEEISVETEIPKINFISELWEQYEKNYVGAIIRHSEIQRKIAIQDIIQTGGKILFNRIDQSLTFIESPTTAEEKTFTSTVDANKEQEGDCDVKITVLADYEASLLKAVYKAYRAVKASTYHFIIPTNLPIVHLKPFLRLEKYGMVHFLELDENSIFTTKKTDDLKYSILVDKISEPVFMYLMMD